MSGASITIEDVRSLREKLHDAGYRPVPVYTAEAGRRLGHMTPGKHPKGDGWQEGARADPPAAVTQRPTNDATNTGILCDGLRVLDLDIDDWAAANRCAQTAAEMFGEAPTRFRANSPRRAIVYRAAEGEPHKRALTGKLGKIEVLGKGQQFVAFGDHESGARLQWTAALETVVREDLPPVTEDQIAQYLSACAAVIGAEPPERGNGLDQDRQSRDPETHARRDTWGFLDNAIDHDSLTAGAMALLNAGMHDGAVVNFLRATVTSLHDVDEDRRSRRLSEIPDMVSSARAKLGGVAPAGAGEVECAHLDPLPIDQIPPQPWAYGKFLLFGSAAVMGALDGVGKGFVTTAMILSVVTGQALLGEQVWRSGPVAIVTYEDDEMEWRRRIAAACLYHHVDYDLALANIYFIRRKMGRVTFAEQLGGRTLFPDSEAIISRLRAVGAVILVIDPFNSAHTIDDGNNNVLIARVAGEISRIASAGGVAALVLHHLRKGASGAVDDLMGATALRANFRACRILQRMTADQAEKLDITPDQCFRYIRIASSKENYAPPPDKAAWFKLESQPLGNGTKLYPDGDNIGVATVWRPPAAFDGVSLLTLKAIFDALREGAGEGWFYSIDPRAKYPAHGLVTQTAGVSKSQAISMLKTWVENGVLVKERYKTPKRDDSFRVGPDDAKVAAILAPLRTFGASDD